jgi:hypothetical protein
LLHAEQALGWARRGQAQWLLLATKSFANFFADSVFLLVQDTLLSFGDMTAVLARHVTFFLADLVVFVVQGIRLPFCDLAFLQLAIDAPVLVVEARIDFRASRVVLRPFARRST